MTELMNLDRLNEIARVSAEPGLPAQKPIVTLEWSIDAATGRPVGRWVVGEAPDTAGA
ncbi:MAG TPA: hypothetical protein VMA86_11365 [Acetobacteraceae bacterium]|nr:hypothetical protein [Acetobacteraceae bacterium]